MIPQKILDREKTEELVMDSFFQSANIFLSETKNLKYILVIDKNIEFVNKVRKILNKYKEQVLVVRASTMSEGKIFIKNNKNSIQAILVEYKPQIVKEISQDTETTIPIVFIMKDRIRETLSDLFLENRSNSLTLVTALGL